MSAHGIQFSKGCVYAHINVCRDVLNLQKPAMTLDYWEKIIVTVVQIKQMS